MTWFEENPSWLQEEFESLAALGVSYEIDEKEKLNGYLVVRVYYPVGDDVLELDCHFPDSYPYFPIEIFCDNFPEGRHLEPSSKSLCLLADKYNDWDPQSDNLAGIIQKQVTEIYWIHKNPDVVSESESALEGYQPSGQLNVEMNSVIVTTSNAVPERKYGIGKIAIQAVTNSNQAIRGCFRSAVDYNQHVVFDDQTTYYKHFDKEIPIRWVKLSETIKSTDVNGIYKQAVEQNHALENRIYHKSGHIEIDIIAVCYPEETIRGEIDHNWCFIVHRKWKDKGNKNLLVLVRSDHMHPTYQLSRTPNLIGLAEKKVVVIGLGALGSHVTWQLARAGIKNFNLVDKDFLQVGNLQRWIIGLPFVGLNKTEAVKRLLQASYIDINANIYNLEIGSVAKIKELGSSKIVGTGEYLVTNILNDADIVIDCSAMLNINQYLSMLCKKLNIDYVWSSATNGAWGGIVGKSPSSYKNDVWFDFNIEYGERKIPPIATEPSPFVQPKGCFHPTFTGTGFDLDTISIMTTRMAVSLLNGDRYGSFDFDVAILEQWVNGRPVAPRWKELKYYHA